MSYDVDNTPHSREINDELFPLKREILLSDAVNSDKNSNVGRERFRGFMRMSVCVCVCFAV